MQIDLTDFLTLSAFLNLQLSATGVGRENTLAIILGRKTLPQAERDVLLLILEYLDGIYDRRQRRLGPLAVLHPLRATALLARALPHPTLLDLLTSLLHDKLEDIRPEEVGPDAYAGAEARYAELLHRIDPTDQWFLMERLDWLTRRQHESYFQYIGRLLDRATSTPEVVRVKLADRLDNTLDARIDLADPIEGVDFFETVFGAMFVPGYHAVDPGGPHPARSPISGAQRLFQLFKNAVLLSLVRRRHSTDGDSSAVSLFRALAAASMKEAQRIALHVHAFHGGNAESLRALLVDTMQYAQSGGLDRVTLANDARSLDGLFATVFDGPSSVERSESLRRLAEDHPRRLEAALAFVVIFLRFLADPAYVIDDLSEEGIHPRQ
jgi:hypothetical protein